MVCNIHIHPACTVLRINAYIEEEVQRRLQDLHRGPSEDSATPADARKVSGSSQAVQP